MAFLKDDLAFNVLFFVTKFRLSYVVSVLRSITKEVVLELAGMWLILRVSLDHILSVTTIYGLFKYLRRNVEALELTEVDVVNLATKYEVG